MIRRPMLIRQEKCQEKPPSEEREDDEDDDDVVVVDDADDEEDDIIDEDDEDDVQSSGDTVPLVVAEPQHQLLDSSCNSSSSGGSGQASSPPAAAALTDPHVATNGSKQAAGSLQLQLPPRRLSSRSHPLLHSPMRRAPALPMLGGPSPGGDSCVVSLTVTDESTFTEDSNNNNRNPGVTTTTTAGSSPTSSFCSRHSANSLYSNNNNMSNRNFIDVPILAPLRAAASVDESLLMPIPTFTVTINPMEDNEITYVPESPPENMTTSQQPLAEIPPQMPAAIAPVHQKPHAEDKKSRLAPNDSQESSDEVRRSSIGSASSLMMDNRLCVSHLSIRRVSEISHINELRREVSGMDHMTSENYEIVRGDPDNISLDSIHKTVFKRCQNKYIPPQRSSTQNKCFVIVTSGFTVLGIIYGFWYKNFGPGSDLGHN